MSIERPLTFLLVDDSKTKQHNVLDGIEAWARLPQTRERPLPQRIKDILQNTQCRIQVILDDNPFSAQNTLRAMPSQIDVMFTDNEMEGGQFAVEMMNAAGEANVRHRVVYTSSPITGIETSQIILPHPKKLPPALIEEWLENNLGPYVQKSANDPPQTTGHEAAA